MEIRKKGALILDSEWLEDEDEVLARVLYDDHMLELTGIMDEKNKAGYWRCTAKGLGWRNSNGSKTFRAENGQSLLFNILPRTDNHYRVYNERHGFVIINSHHDSQHEEYWVRPCASSAIES